MKKNGKRVEVRSTIKMEMISVNELRVLCNELLSDIETISSWNPNLTVTDAFLWMLMGSLVSLLSVQPDELADIYDPEDQDHYFKAVVAILTNRLEPSVDPEHILNEFLKTLDAVSQRV